MAGFQLSINGRFWVSTEERSENKGFGGGGSRPCLASPQGEANLAGYAADIDRAIARDMEAAGVGLPRSSNSRMISTSRRAQSARNDRTPGTGTKQYSGSACVRRTAAEGARSAPSSDRLRALPLPSADDRFDDHGALASGDALPSPIRTDACLATRASRGPIASAERTRSRWRMVAVGRLICVRAVELRKCCLEDRGIRYLRARSSHSWRYQGLTAATEEPPTRYWS